MRTVQERKNYKNVKGDRDHNGLLAVGKIHVQFLNNILFYVSTVTPFYIMGKPDM
jgi:hypothetical protein